MSLTSTLRKHEKIPSHNQHCIRFTTQVLKQNTKFKTYLCPAMKFATSPWMTVAVTTGFIKTGLAELQLAQSKKCVSTCKFQQRGSPHRLQYLVLITTAVPRTLSKFFTTQQGLVSQLDSLRGTHRFNLVNRCSPRVLVLGTPRIDQGCL